MFKIMFYVGLMLAIIFLVISIVLFVRNGIAKLVGDVTGWNTRQAMKKIHRISAKEKSLNVNVNIQEVTATTLPQKRSALVENEKALLKDNQTILPVKVAVTLLEDGKTRLLTEKLSSEKEIHKKSLKKVSVSDDFFEVEESVTVTHTEECIDV